MSLRKIVSAVVTATTLLTMSGPAFAVTAEELLQQIQQLQQQLNQLMAQYQQLTGQAATTTAGVPAACVGVTFDRDLKLGMSGADVKCLQALLNAQGCKVAETGAGSPGNETTYFGPKTKAAVICFQEKYKDEILTPAGLTKGTGYVGAKTRAKLNALLQAGAVAVPQVPPAPVFEPMKVKVAEDTPVAANIQRGTPNNPVLKIVLTGSETETVNVSGITLTQYGNVPDNQIIAVRLWDENGVQLGSDRTLVGGRAMFVLVPTLQIPAKGTRTITVTVDVKDNAETLTTVQLGVNAATDITGAAFTGNFPLKGNIFTVVPAGAYGSLTASSLAIPKITAKIGEKDVVLNRFVVSAGAREDVTLRQIAIENLGSALDTDITNIRVREIGGAVVGGPVNLSAKKAVINLVGVAVTKGTSKRFEVVADVVSGKSRTLQLRVNSIIGVGVTSGISIIASGTPFAASSVTIEAGTLSIAQSTNHPVGTAAAFVATLNAKPIGVFSVRAVGEDILISKVILSFTGVSTDNYLTSVGLYDGDSLVSDLKDAVNTTTDYTFTLSWTVPANTTKDLTVKAVTKNAGTAGGNQITVTLKSTSEGFGLASGETITPAANVSLSPVTVYSRGEFTATLDDAKTPLNQGVLVGLNDVLLGGIKVRATREDMKLYKLVVTSDVNTATSDAVASITLYDEAGNALSNPKNVANGVFTIGPEDLLTNVIFPKDTYKTILVKGRVVGNTGTNQYFLKVAAAGDFQAVGVESEATVTSSPATLNLGSDVQGKFYLSDTVLEMKKNASSPSGSVSRGSAEVYAIWDVTNPTNANATLTTIILTSKTGLPSGVATTDFKLIDETGATVAAAANSTSSNTVGFTGLTWVIPAGSTKQLKLVINTVDTARWPSGTQMQWTVAAVSDVTLDSGYVGYAGTVWSIPADTNVVKLP
jgi:peptidoglycan hydrolase-like protein with peptidoglycan-binding domain